MNLEAQVVSLELAKKLKELGVVQESLFYFSRVNVSGKYELDFGIRGPWETVDTEHAISAFTVAELGEMLPATPIIEEKLYYLTCCKYAKWNVRYVHYDQGIGHLLGGYPVINGDTEADARAKMLIYLIENKLI